MRYRKLDANGDMVFGSGKNDYITEVEAVKQAVKTRLLLLYNEWWENAEDGLPLFELIAGHRDKGTAEKEIQERIQGTQHVISVKNIQTSFERRGFYFSCDLQTEYGQTNFSFYFGD